MLKEDWVGISKDKSVIHKAYVKSALLQQIVLTLQNKNEKLCSLIESVIQLVGVG